MRFAASNSKVIALYVSSFNERGVTGSTIDYASAIKKYLNYDAVLLYERNNPFNSAKKIQQASREFDVIAVDSPLEIDDVLEKIDASLLYTQRSGFVERPYSKTIPTMVHAVFAQNLLQVHGSSYAFISEWLSAHCSFGMVPTVPLIVKEVNISNIFDLRKRLGIPTQATVISSLGGSTSFDIQFVRDCVREIAEACPDTYFLFMNYGRFCELPNVIFLEKCFDQAEKDSFVYASDVMLHGRRLGETFGLACAEYSRQFKPILSYAHSKDRHHHYLLGNSIHLYSNKAELIHLIELSRQSKLLTPNPGAYGDGRYSEERCMHLFEKHLIYPALSESKAKRFCVNSIVPARCGLQYALSFLPDIYKRLKIKLKILFRHPSL